MSVEWRKIKGYEKYSVSNTGLVRNDLTGKIMLPCTTRKGYLRLNLTENGTQKNRLVHRLVAQAFVPNPNNLEVVDHINGIKDDNRVENLQWLTSQDNTKKFWIGMSEERRDKIKRFLVGNANRYRKSVSKPVICIDTGAIYESSGHAARELGICRSSILRVANGTYEQVHGYHFKFLGE